MACCKLYFKIYTYVNPCGASMLNESHNKDCTNNTSNKVTTRALLKMSVRSKLHDPPKRFQHRTLYVLSLKYLFFVFLLRVIFFKMSIFFI